MRLPDLNNIVKLRTYQTKMNKELYKLFLKVNMFEINEKCYESAQENKQDPYSNDLYIHEFILFVNGQNLQAVLDEYDIDIVYTETNFKYIFWDMVDFDYLCVLQKHLLSEKDKHVFFAELLTNQERNPVIKKYINFVLDNKTINLNEFVMRPGTDLFKQDRTVMLYQGEYLSVIDIAFRLFDNIQDKKEILYRCLMANKNEELLFSFDISEFILSYFTQDECREIIKNKSISNRNLYDIVAESSWDKEYFYSLKSGNTSLYMLLPPNMLIHKKWLDKNYLDVNDAEVIQYLTNHYSVFCSDGIDFAFLTENLKSQKGETLLHYVASLLPASLKMVEIFELFSHNKKFVEEKNKDDKNFIECLLAGYNYGEVITILCARKDFIIEFPQLFESIKVYIDNLPKMNQEIEIIHDLLIMQEKEHLLKSRDKFKNLPVLNRL